MEYLFHTASPLGPLTLSSDGEALTGLWFDGQKYFADTLDPEHTERELPVFAESLRWLELYFGGRAPDFIPPLRMKGSSFRAAVWELLLTIPYGTTRSYGELAAQLAQRLNRPHLSAQAVGGAVSHNPISLIIPCHRVLGAKGELTGYAGGLDRKAMLLALEQTGKLTCQSPTNLYSRS